MTELPVIESCDGCGACCMTQAAPPFCIDFDTGPNEFDAEDRNSLATMPAEAKALLDERDAAFDRGEGSDDTPCVWFDLTTRRCRFYDWRPTICREFERGSEACVEWRAEFLSETGQA